MSYTPTEWQTGDVITAEKLNNIEGGVTAALPVMYITFDGEGVCNKTWQQIHDAIAGGTAVVSVMSPAENLTEFGIVCYTYVNVEDGYGVMFYSDGGQQPGAVASTADDYPVLE